MRFGHQIMRLTFSNRHPMWPPTNFSVSFAHQALVCQFGGDAPVAIVSVLKEGEELATIFEEPFDIWRESLLRYLGYSNELGEAFRPLVGDFIANSTYAVAITYVMADAVDKAQRASSKSRQLAATAVFNDIDQRLDGHLTYDAVSAAFKNMQTNMSDSDVDGYLKRLDVRGDSRVHFDEFYLALKRRDPELLLLLEAGASLLPEDAARCVQGTGHKQCVFRGAR